MDSTGSLSSRMSMVLATNSSERSEICFSFIIKVARKDRRAGPQVWPQPT